MKKVLAILVLGLVLCNISFADEFKKKILKQINVMSSTDKEHYYFFGHTNLGKAYWGRIEIKDYIPKHKVTFVGQAHSGDVEYFRITGGAMLPKCKMRSEQLNFNPPFKGKFTILCYENGEWDITGTWNQENKNAIGIGTGSNRKGHKVTAFFSKDKNIILEKIKSYKTNQVQEAKKEEKKKLSKNFIQVNFCTDVGKPYATSFGCSKTWHGKSTYEVFLTKVKKPICYSKKEDRVQVRTRCNKSLERYEVKHDGKNFYWSSEETQIAKKEPTQTEDKTKKQATVTSETSSSDNNYRELVKKFGSECESSWSNFFTGHKVGTPEFDQCLAEKQNEQIKLAKLEAEKLKTEKEIYLSLSPEEKRAYTCANTFGFKKGSDKFRDCIFKIYATELELAKLEVEKQLAEALLATAKANVEAAQAKVAAAKAEGLLQKAQIQAVEAQAAATRQQAAASKAQAAATNQQSSISLMLQGLQMLQPTQTQSSFNTTCTWMGNFMNCW